MLQGLCGAGDVHDDGPGAFAFGAPRQRVDALRGIRIFGLSTRGKGPGVGVGATTAEAAFLAGNDEAKSGFGEGQATLRGVVGGTGVSGHR